MMLEHHMETVLTANRLKKRGKGSLLLLLSLELGLQYSQEGPIALLDG